MSLVTRTWVVWVAVTMAVAVAYGYLLGFWLAGLEYGYLMFAGGMAYSAFTVPVLRWISRRIR